MSITRMIKRAITLFKEEKLIPIVKPVSRSSLLEGSTALITGGSGGIGMAIAEAFMNSGAGVIIAGTNDEKLSKCLRKLRNGGGALASQL